MASIQCPKCGDVLYDFIIDAIAGGSNVTGSGAFNAPGAEESSCMRRSESFFQG